MRKLRFEQLEQRQLLAACAPDTVEILPMFSGDNESNILSPRSYVAGEGGKIQIAALDNSIIKKFAVTEPALDTTFELKGPGSVSLKISPKQYADLDLQGSTLFHNRITVIETISDDSGSCQRKDTFFLTRFASALGPGNETFYVPFAMPNVTRQMPIFTETNSSIPVIIRFQDGQPGIRTGIYGTVPRVAEFRASADVPQGEHSFIADVLIKDPSTGKFETSGQLQFKTNIQRKIKVWFDKPEIAFLLRWVEGDFSKPLSDYAVDAERLVNDVKSYANGAVWRGLEEAASRSDADAVVTIPSLCLDPEHEDTVTGRFGRNVDLEVPFSFEKVMDEWNATEEHPPWIRYERTVRTLNDFLVGFRNFTDRPIRVELFAETLIQRANQLRNSSPREVILKTLVHELGHTQGFLGEIIHERPVFRSEDFRQDVMSTLFLDDGRGERTTEFSDSFLKIAQGGSWSSEDLESALEIVTFPIVQHNYWQTLHGFNRIAEDAVPVAESDEFLRPCSTNHFDRNDVNSDGKVTPLDALLVINALSAVHWEPSVPDTISAVDSFFDTSADGVLTPRDALLVINRLSSPLILS